MAGRRRSPVWLEGDAPFPDPGSAPKEGLLAIGGELSLERLLEAYRLGIFPWYDESSPVLWWSPDPRFLLYPRDLHVSRSLRQRMRSGRYEVRFDTAFDEVVRLCASAGVRGREGTWITPAIFHAFSALHLEGHAHSAESWRDGRLVGGLYGLALGGAFFGESMFTVETDASKVAFAVLVRKLEAWGFDFVDCQLPTRHLASLGAVAVPRQRFLEELAAAVARPVRVETFAPTS